MNDSGTVEMSKHIMYGPARNKHSKADEIERAPDSTVSSDLGEYIFLNF